MSRAEEQRNEISAESADGQGHDGEEDHDRAVHRAELVVELGREDAGWRIVGAEEPADDRHRGAGIGELPADHHDQHEAGQEKQRCRGSVEKAGDFVVRYSHGRTACTLP